MTGYYFTHEVLMFHHLGGHSVHKVVVIPLSEQLAGYVSQIEWLKATCTYSPV